MKLDKLMRNLKRNKVNLTSEIGIKWRGKRPLKGNMYRVIINRKRNIKIKGIRHEKYKINSETII